ncbi:hypothetical protein E5347_15555 [Clostridium sartagoforme]|uniref:Uncharacterized protein n=1 Tax=Clostridium sartagoforme TaxID=84031 RepID=A0A4S2DE54_9CLOT|nr:hypothetical protein [Clostridium sartagoforme]TGY40227.1 hypothetical protein E5347_15555 [Clostridium sartagoforme]
MRKYLFIFTLIINSLFLISCNEDNVLKPDSPTNTSILIKNYIDADNYEEFKGLLSEDLDNSISKEEFNKFKDIVTAGSNHNLYDIITFENGEMLLIKLTSTPVNDEYKVEEVIQVPAELKTFFNSN